MSDPIQPLLDILNALVTTGRRLGSGVWLDEVQFYTATANLKRSLPASLIAAANKAAQAGPPGGPPEGFPVFKAIDDLEQFVETARGHVFGRVLVNRNAYLERVEAVATALGRNVGRTPWSG